MPFTNDQNRDHIREMQRYLHAISEINEAIPVIIPDGIYGAETEIAVRGFQREYGLPETGQADSETWDSIIRIYRGEQSREPERLNVFPSAEYIAGYGDTGTLVYVIQALLERLSRLFDNVPKVTVSGIFDSETVHAVSFFQKCWNLEQNGNVDSITWNMISKHSGQRT